MQLFCLSKQATCLLGWQLDGFLRLDLVRSLSGVSARRRGGEMSRAGVVRRAAEASLD